MNLDSLLTGENAAFLDDQYVAWLRDPSAVEPELRVLFEGLEPPRNGVIPGSRPAPDRRSIFDPRGDNAGALPATGEGLTYRQASQIAERQARVAQLINAYRVRGHTMADIDPLGRREQVPHPELELAWYGLSEADLDVRVSSHPLFGAPRETTLRHIIERLEKSYCGGLGVEFMNIQEPHKKIWLQERLETLQDGPVMTLDEKKQVLAELSDAENFERNVHTRFPGTKRFSLEGGESLVALLDEMIEKCGETGIKEIVVGMAHRGRLNVLTNVMNKPPHLIIEEFQDEKGDTVMGSGDVKYHLGYSSDHVTRGGHEVHLSLTFNPSHLEAVNAVVEGRVRAKQDRQGKGFRGSCLPLLIHGDAAFAGQGLVAEVFNLSDLKGYRTGGSIHVIVNNQIGFTTNPVEARSTPYATDVARMMAIPIFHVNGEDLDALIATVRLAVEWRQTFREDVVIDMYCYRKHGHNEGDDPSFTQPLMYDTIRKRAPVHELYARHLVEVGDLSQAEADAIQVASRDRMDRAMDLAGKNLADEEYDSPLKQIWREWSAGDRDAPTGVPKDRLVALLTRANTVPDSLSAHRKLKRILKQRHEMISGARPLDWAMGEQAAFASLLTEGYRVRLSGQDSQRGTFSHRHACWTDVETGREYFALSHLSADQANFRVYDSMLSEAGVLGFEFGYSLDYPEALIIWEAQFGDFANGGQVMFDQFIAAAEQKWHRFSGLVMLLPHGYEGQGPEHSSARLERYLQCCAEDNIQVANCTTPANFFHLLRRQVLRRVRKPLIVMAPKSLLRHPLAVSTLDDLAEGAFQRLIPEVDDLDPAGVRRLILCSGKIYYELLQARRERNESRIAIARVEEIYPVPEAALREQAARYPGAEIVWCQEEPRNMGAWPMYDEWLEDALGQRPRYVGRRAAAAPATGSNKKHHRQQAAIIAQALALD